MADKKSLEKMVKCVIDGDSEGATEELNKYLTSKTKELIDNSPEEIDESIFLEAQHEDEDEDESDEDEDEDESDEDEDEDDEDGDKDKDKKK